MISMIFFHAVVVLTYFLSILITITLNSISEKLLASISFSAFSRDSSCSFFWGLFLCVPILPLSLSLFIFKYFIYLFLEKVKGKEKERERNIDV